MSSRIRVVAPLVAVGIAVAALSVGCGGSSNTGGESIGSTSTAIGSATSTVPAAAQKITVRDGEAVGGVQTIDLKQNDVANFVVVSDNTSDEVHVHGYDLMKDVSPGHPVHFRFPASISGVFEVELESLGHQIAELKVEP